MADKKHYKKPALTFEEQLRRLKDRGIQVEDMQVASRALSQVSYYRLSAYWYPFRIREDGGNVQSAVEPGTTFQRVLDLYNFDSKLRRTVL